MELLMSDTPKLPQEQMADISIGHISLRDVNTLEGITDLESCIIKYPTGFFIYTGGSDADSQDSIRQAYTIFGLSDAFLAVISLAAKQKCKWVCFDADGPRIEGLAYKQDDG